MSVHDTSNPMRCANPIDAAVLADYWLGILPGKEEEAAELHLLNCDSCGARLRELIALAAGVRNLTREGSLLMIVSDALLERVTQEGLRVREYAPPPGGSIACTVTAEDDFLVGRLTADLSQAKRVDLCLCDARRTERLRLADIPFNSSAGSVAFQQSITYAKAAPSETMIARLVSCNDAGGESLLGEYTFNHRRTLPGPGAW
jgi:hypothetical protein